MWVMIGLNQLFFIPTVYPESLPTKHYTRKSKTIPMKDKQKTFLLSFNDAHNAQNRPKLRPNPFQTRSNPIPNRPQTDPKPMPSQCQTDPKQIPNRGSQAYGSRLPCRPPSTTDPSKKGDRQTGPFERIMWSLPATVHRSSFKKGDRQTGPSNYFGNFLKLLRCLNCRRWRSKIRYFDLNFELYMKHPL